MKLKIAQVVGLNTDQRAAQVSSSSREDDNNVLAVLLIESDDAFTKGRQILSELEDFYFESEGAVGQKLEATFAEAEKKLSSEINSATKEESDPETPQSGTGVSEWDICLAAISGKVLYLIGKGQVEVYLKRGDKLSPLLSVGTPAQLISGFLSDSDRLLFSTRSLSALLGEQLEKTLSLPIEVFEEEVGSRIGASGLENQGLAALAVEVYPEVQPGAEVNGEDLEISPISGEEPKVEEELPSPKVNLILSLLPKVVLFIGRVRAYFPRSGRGRLILAILLIAIVASGVGYQYKLSRDQKTNAQFQQLLQGAKDDFTAAQGLATLNPVEAKTKLELAKDKVNKALSLKPKDSDATALKNQIEGDSGAILQQSSVSEFPVFLDLDLIKKNFRAERLSLSGGKLLVLDPGVKTLAVVDLAKKSNQILAGSEKMGDALFASLNGGLAFIYSKDKGILKIDTANSKLTSVAKKDSDLTEVKDIYGFAGNVYLLDASQSATGSGQIWKYLPAKEDYSDKRPYLNKDVKADFDGAIRMQIESSIYALKSGGEILRFTKGNKDNFSLEGLDKGVKDPKSFFVSSETDNLYVLDSGNSRLLILTKTGSYKGQVTGSNFGTATDLVVDEKEKKVYLLEGSKIFQVDLK